MERARTAASTRRPVIVSSPSISASAVFHFLLLLLLRACRTH